MNAQRTVDWPPEEVTIRTRPSPPLRAVNLPLLPGSRVWTVCRAVKAYWSAMQPQRGTDKR